MGKHKLKVQNCARKYDQAFITIGILIIVGCVIGVLLSYFLDKDKLETINELYADFKISSEFNTKLLFDITSKYLIIFILLWACSFSVYMIPVSVLTAFLKGIKMGFSSGVIVRSMGIKRYAFLGVNLLIQNLIFIPVLIIFTVFCIQNALKKKTQKHIKNYKAIKIGEAFGIFAVSIFLGVFESLVISLVY